MVAPPEPRLTGVYTTTAEIPGGDTAGQTADLLRHYDRVKAEIAADYERVRSQHAAKKGVPLVSLDAARNNAFAWNSDGSYRPQAPKKPGLHVLRNIDLSTLADYIDWGPFFQTWDLAGSYPKILDDEIVGETARELTELPGVKAIYPVFPVEVPRGQASTPDIAHSEKCRLTRFSAHGCTPLVR